MNKVIAVDVDFTLVRTDIEWYKSLTGALEVGSADYMFNLMLKHNTSKLGIYDLPEIPYNLSLLFGDTPDFSFWEDPDLYDMLEPVAHSVEALHILKSAGYDIVFVSKIFSGHYNSKVRFLNKHYPFHDGIIATDTKHHIKCDYIIDDRMDNMADASHAVRLVYNTPYDQGNYNSLYRELVNARNEGLRIGNYMMVSDWQDICNLILTNKI